MYIFFLFHLFQMSNFERFQCPKKIMIGDILTLTLLWHFFISLRALCDPLPQNESFVTCHRFSAADQNEEGDLKIDPHHGHQPFTVHSIP